MRIPLPIAIALLAAAPAPAQSGVLDQASPFGTASFHLANPLNTWQIQVRSGTGGLLEGFTLHYRANSPALLRLRVRRGDAWNTSTAPWIGYFTAPATGGSWQSQFFDCSAGDLRLAAHETFVIELTGGGSQSALAARGAYVAPPGAPPYPEPLFLNGSVYGDNGWRIGFRTWMIPGPSLSILGSCPGIADVVLSGFTPNGFLVVGGSTTAAPYVIPGGPCAGALFGLVSPTAHWILVADAVGSAFIPNVLIPPLLCDIYSLQGFDVSTCTGSNVVAL